MRQHLPGKTVADDKLSKDNRIPGRNSKNKFSDLKKKRQPFDRYAR